MAAHGARVHKAGNELHRLEACAHLPARLLVALPSSIERVHEETGRRCRVLVGRRSTPWATWSMTGSSRWLQSSTPPTQGAGAAAELANRSSTRGLGRGKQGGEGGSVVVQRSGGELPGGSSSGG
ncbi:hypothetical protein CFC21_008958 [Triticum aestivum]|uniref:Uncharacterized protein n=2 Tax=Triticum aestivum TaxID=4565 RepID=A0A3B5Z416_WHEAT|nr:hypothetical protein CFC21_008958 [Triticum aestivum]